MSKCTGRQDEIGERFGRLRECGDERWAVFQVATAGVGARVEGGAGG